MSPRTYTHDIEVQYRDLDPRKHVNHAVYVSYLEQAKGRFFADVLGVSLADVDTVIRTLEVDYRTPIPSDRAVRVALHPVGVGETSLTIEYEVTADGRAAATARTVSVLLDGNGRPRPLPEEWRSRLEAYLHEERSLFRGRE